jgi:RNA polymerase primary sigma factor
MRQRKRIALFKDAPIKDSLKLDLYFKDIDKFGRLETEKEQELFVAYRSGDHPSRETLIVHNLKFVVSVAKHYQRSVVGIQLSDLISYGNIGLMKAIERYDESLGYRFISFAVWWIRQCIVDHLRIFNTVITYPQNFYLANIKIKTFIEEFYKLNEREPSDMEVYQFIEDNEIRVTAYSDICYEKTISLDSELMGNQQQSIAGLQSYHDVIEDVNASKPDEYEGDANTVMVRRLVHSLPEREKGIILHCFGIDGYPILSIDELAETFKVSSERIRQIKRTALASIKNGIETISL